MGIPTDRPLNRDLEVQTHGRGLTTITPYPGEEKGTPKGVSLFQLQEKELSYKF